MKKILIASLLTTTFLPGLVRAQFDALDWKSEYTLHAYLMEAVREQYRVRNEAIRKAFSGKKEMQAYRDSARSRYMAILGDLPEKAPLNPKVTGIIRQDGYRIEKVIYESLPEHRVTANLYVPDGEGRFPGVLLFCGHEKEAKATPSYQKTAILFARNGFVVLAIDPISQGERYQLTGKNGEPLTRGGTTEHTLLNAGANLLGTSVAAYELWDNIRSLDYLLSRKEVDPGRIGCLGNSGGGTQTTYFAAYEPRIKAAAVCSYLARRERNFELSGAADGCQHILFEGREQLEINDFLIMAASTPMLILAGKYDFVDIEGTRRSFRELKRAYETLGRAEKTDMFVYDDGHGISRPKREAAVSWFSRWLKQTDAILPEENPKPLPVEALNCTSSGAVNADFPEEKGVDDYNRILARQYRDARSALLNDASLPGLLREALNTGSADFEVDAEVLPPVDNKGYAFQKLVLRSPGFPPVPALAYIPDGRVEKVVVWLHPDGKSAIAGSPELARLYAAKNTALVLADVRGVGETADHHRFNDPKYYNSEYANAMMALHIGKPLPGQRVEDVFMILNYIDGLPALKDALVEVRAGGANMLTGLYAAALDQRIDRLVGAMPWRSFEEILENPVGKDFYSWIVPGILKFMDLPDIERYVKNRIAVAEPGTPAENNRK